MTFHESIVANVRRELAENLKEADRELTFYNEAYARRERLAKRNRELLDWLAEYAPDPADAHPEPTPWHDAKPGDVWLLKFAGFETAGAAPWTVRHGKRVDDPLEFVYPQNGNTVALTDVEIIEARRIYPEVTE